MELAETCVRITEEVGHNVGMDSSDRGVRTDEEVIGSSEDGKGKWVALEEDISVHVGVSAVDKNVRIEHGVHDKVVHRLDIVFLMETIYDHNAMERLRVKLGFDAKLVVNRECNSGGLGIFWNSVIEVSLLSYSCFHIDTVVTSHNNKRWRLTGFYGNPNTSQRIHGWTLLRRFVGMASYPWLVGEEFNEILFMSEKMGGVSRQEVLMDNFRDVLEDCGLRDLGYFGPRFTWSNKRGSDQLV
ncbi:hypothetical protein Dsin_012351 [Dipteronia sinensis]|uniref:Reverse transcriptase n=1 Tax=Dipteronia sinensis TaxID=43782 RepID=A0AAE0AHV4_9ROSI|nr:hypothetical protein Dsin_012351 [Dipteronia sinensis]